MSKNPMGDFETAVRPHRRELVLLARRLTRSHATAEDVVQDALVRAWKAWDRWKPKYPEKPEQCLRGWLIRIMTNVFGNHYRVHVAEMKMIGDQAPPGQTDYIAGESHSAQPPAPDLVVENGFSDEVTEALASILPERRDAILLNAAGMPAVEVAQTLGFPNGTAFSRLFRARADLAERLDEYAAREYGIGPRASGRARVDSDGLEPVQELEPDADAVDDVVSDTDDALALAL